MEIHGISIFSYGFWDILGTNPTFPADFTGHGPPG